MDHSPLPATIGVGVDGSEESSHVLTWALALASAIGARVVVCHGTGLLEGAGFQPAVDLETELAVAGARLGSDGESLGTRIGTVLIRKPGHPVDVLLAAALEHGVDLLAVGRRGVGRNLAALGSTSEAVVAMASVPVVVFPPAYQGGGAS